MASGVFYANSSESVGLYGNTVYFGQTYFEWYIFKTVSEEPATPTGGSWDFTTNTGTVPAGWTTFPPTDYTGRVWCSITVVDSTNPTAPLVWSNPGVFSGAGAGGATGGGTNQVFFENDTNVTDNYEITTGRNAMSAGPITVDSGVVVTVPVGSVWTIV